MLTDLRLAYRTLCKAPTFAVTAVIVLTIGIGANTAVFSALDTLLFRPLPYRDADRLVMMGDLDRTTGFRTGTSLFRWRQWSARVRSFDAIAAVEPGLTARWGPGSEASTCRWSAPTCGSRSGRRPMQPSAWTAPFGSSGACEAA